MGHQDRRPHYDPETIHELIAYVKGRRNALRAELERNDSYGGPDPAPGRRERAVGSIETLDGVLGAIRDIETKKSKARLADALGLDD